MHVLHVLQHFFGSPSVWAAIIAVVAAAQKVSDNWRQLIKLLLLVLPTGVLLASVPLLVILLASNGSINVLDLHWSSGWADQLALAFDFLIPCFLVFLPQLIRRRMQWHQCAPSDPGLPNLQNLLPTWLAVLASLATAGLIFTLHFARGGQLASQTPAVVIAASIGIVLLLLPFYSLLARASWERKYTEVFNPVQWVREQRSPWKAMWNLLTVPPAPPAAPPAEEPVKAEAAGS